MNQEKFLSVKEEKVRLKRGELGTGQIKGQRTKYNDFKNTVITKSNNTRENTPNNYRTRYREQDSNNRKYDKEKSSEYRVFQECPNTNKNKGKMYDMSEKCRVHEHKSRERKILLDSFSKSNLIKHNAKEKLK